MDITLGLRTRTMAALLMSPPSVYTSTSTSSLTSIAPPLLKRSVNNHGGRSVRRSISRNAVIASCSAGSTQGIGLQRRNLVLLVLSSSAPLLLPPSALFASSEMATFVDDINACSYAYPTVLPSTESKFKWIISRQPERYSSAAPLTPDARWRIVSERVDMINNAVISISIGPPNPTFLSSNDKKSWNANDVADSVLSDKSSLRVTTSQRMQESSVLDSHASEIDGEPYWYCEYIVRKSPTNTAPETNTFRHFVSATAEREGYLYSLTASTLSKQWELMGPVLKQTVESFRLLPPTDNYVPPYKDPWRFW